MGNHSSKHQHDDQAVQIRLLEQQNRLLRELLENPPHQRPLGQAQQQQEQQQEQPLQPPLQQQDVQQEHQQRQEARDQHHQQEQQQRHDHDFNQRQVVEPLGDLVQVQRQRLPQLQQDHQHQQIQPLLHPHDQDEPPLQQRDLDQPQDQQQQQLQPLLHPRDLDQQDQQHQQHPPSPLRPRDLERHQDQQQQPQLQPLPLQQPQPQRQPQDQQQQQQHPRNLDQRDVVEQPRDLAQVLQEQQEHQPQPRPRNLDQQPPRPRDLHQPQDQRQQQLQPPPRQHDLQQQQEQPRQLRDLNQPLPHRPRDLDQIQDQQQQQHQPPPNPQGLAHPAPQLHHPFQPQPRQPDQQGHQRPAQAQQQQQPLPHRQWPLQPPPQQGQPQQDQQPRQPREGQRQQQPGPIRNGEDEFVRYFQNQKGLRKLAYKGYYFNYQKQSRLDEDLLHYYCEKRSSQSCKVRVHVLHDQVVRQFNEHTHAPDGQRGTVLTVLSEMKELARTVPQNPRNIVAQATNNLPEAIAVKLPSVPNMKKIVQRQNAQANGPVQVQPQNLADMVIPDELQHLENGQLFLLYDSGVQAGNRRILIFSTRESLDVMVQAQSLHSDGTFSHVNRLFGQLYSIHGQLQGEMVPLVTMLLPNKTQATYVDAFRNLANLEPRLNPQKWLSDFEQAAINAILIVFPGTSMSGCFFHFAQSLGLTNAYAEEDGEFATRARCFAAIAFVPVQDVQETFQLLVNDIDDPRFQEFIEYFETTWVGTVGRPPHFQHALWNARERTLEDNPRTNNNLEGWHNSFKHDLKKSSHNVYQQIRVLKEEHLSKTFRIHQLRGGHAPVPQKSVYVILNQRIKRLVTNYDPNQNRLDYLRAISHNTRF